VRDLESVNRLNDKFRELHEKKEIGLICYALAGYPSSEDTVEIVSSMIKGGADIIEIGIPFSDPIADGPIIQEASYNSLIKGMTPRKSLQIIQKIRKRFPTIPIIIMTYSNILFRMGFTAFMRKAKYFGVDGFILPDMPIEESGEYIKQGKVLGLATIFLIAPNTKVERVRSILSKSSGFAYLISVYGTTGLRKSFDKYTADSICRVREIADSKIPIAVGFGISTPAHVKFMRAAGADAIIVASAIVNILKNKTRTTFDDIEQFVYSMKKQCRQSK
jgi:tryptophan synthase alpha chain